MYITTRFAFISAFCLALTACGGGGSGTTTAPSTSTSPAGSTPPATTTPPATATTPIITSHQPRSVMVGNSETFAVSNPDKGEIYTWSFGDGATAQGAVVTHIFSIAGSYNVTVAALNGSTKTVSSTLIVMVIPQPAFSVIAGSAVNPGMNDGALSVASFSAIGGTALDKAGNLYVSDLGNNTIRKITPSGIVATIAGMSGASGFVDGIGSKARFHSPRGLAIDKSGNIYVADSENHSIRKITPSGAVTTLAGNPSTAGTELFFPNRLAVDAAGNVFGTDAGSVIYKITPSGVISTYAGIAGAASTRDGLINNGGFSAMFNSPDGIVIDDFGNIYVTESGGNVVRKITPTGIASTIAGSAGISGSSDGIGSIARFNNPAGIAVDHVGNLYVADRANHTIRMINPSGVVTTLAGKSPIKGTINGSGLNARFNNPDTITIDLSGNLLVTDAYAFAIRKVSMSGEVTPYVGTPLVTGSADGLGKSASFDYPTSSCFDSKGNLYVSDFKNNIIRKVSPAGLVTTIAGRVNVVGSRNGTGAVASFNSPFGIVSDSHDNLYVTDKMNNTIRKITPMGVVSTFAGQAGVRGATDGLGAIASFNDPVGISIDSQDNLYVADELNNTIRKITPIGVVSTVAGQVGIRGATDGVGSNASFNGPYGITVDANDNLYVADTYNSTIRKITADGVVSTIAGTVGKQEIIDGVGLAATFKFPFSISADKNGSIYVADDYVIRKIMPNSNVVTVVGSAGKSEYQLSSLPGSIVRPLSVTVKDVGTIFFTTPTAIIGVKGL